MGGSPGASSPTSEYLSPSELLQQSEHCGDRGKEMSSERSCFLREGLPWSGVCVPGSQGAKNPMSEPQCQVEPRNCPEH